MVRCFGFLFLACCVVFSVSGCVSTGGGENVGSSSQGQLALMGPAISADCIVTFFDGQGSKYISQQHHTIYPQVSAIKVEAAEPEGNFQWELFNGVFKTVRSGSSKSPVTLCSNEIARAIILTVSAKGGFLDDNAGTLLEPMSIAGQVYQPVVLYSVDHDPIKLKIYRDVSSHKVGWVEVGSSKALLAARGYNPRNFKGSDKIMPTSIDIYDTDKDGRPSDRIMKLEYNTYSISK